MLLQNSWYLDDGILVGTEAELMHSLDLLESEGKDLGFNVKTLKCMLWLPQTMSSLDQNIKRLETHHAKVLTERLEKTKPLLDRLQQLDPHAAKAYLKFFLVLPKCCTLYAQLNQGPQLLKSYFIVTMQRGCLELLVEGNVTCSNWKQANCPSSWVDWV